MAATTMVHVRVDNEVKEQAMPIELKVPNAETRAAMEQSRAIIRAHRARFATAEKLFDGLEKNSKR